LANGTNLNGYAFWGLGYMPRKEAPMAKTEEGKKKVHVPSHTRELPGGKTVKVKEHYRSTPN